MSGILVVVEVRRGVLREVSLEAVGAAVALKAAAGGRVVVALVHADADALAPQLALGGVDEVLLVRPPVAEFEPHVLAHAVEALVEAERPALVLTPHSIDAMGFAPAVAARLGLGFASDVTAVRWDAEGPIAVRGAFGGKLETELEFPGKATTLLMLRAGTFPAAAAAAAPAPTVREVAVVFPAPASEHLGYEEVPAADVDITKAGFLLSVGRGIEDEENLERFERLAGLMHATLSVSRPLVDAGWAPDALQVGQSGKTVAPKVYLALGISGAVQHLAGMRGAETIIAVNTDPEAPIFGVAHFGAVADLFDVAEALERRFSP
jgi:electron transfer flavoprotein alpha subunit